MSNRCASQIFPTSGSPPYSSASFTKCYGHDKKAVGIAQWLTCVQRRPGENVTPASIIVAQTVSGELKEVRMASGNDVRRIALSLAGTTEAAHFDRTAFKVARIYVTLAADARSVNLKFAPDEQELKCLLAPEAFVPVAGAWGKKGWTTVGLDVI